MRFTCTSLRRVLALAALLIGCDESASSVVDAGADARDVAPADVVCDAPPEGVCCCAGDQVDQPACGAIGLTCRAGYQLYTGDACRCLADRDTPCCLPHVRLDAGARAD